MLAMKTKVNNNKAYIYMCKYLGLNVIFNK